MDMKQFLDTFFVESSEKLDELERGLLNLEPSVVVDVDLVNDIFRAAHTIKGGAGSFGFKAVSDFTHKMETLLDEVRAEKRDVTPELVELLLEGKDCLVELLDAAKNEEEVQNGQIAAVELRMAQMLDPNTGTREQTQTKQRVTIASGWKINFKPHPTMMHTGNDPLRIIKELADLGTLDVKADYSALPGWNDLVAEDCYLAWEITLQGDITKCQLDDVFLWVEGECDLSLTPLRSNEAKKPVEKAADLLVAVPQTEVIVELRKTDRRIPTGRRKTDKNDNASIRVGIDKIDSVINQVGELITTQSMLSNLNERFDPEDTEAMPVFSEQLELAVSQLERHTRELQEHVMSMRMLPISFVFSRFGRTVHDLCGKLGKKVELHLVGESTELDKTVIEQIGDPLMHLIRNSMDHGFETPQERIDAGKPETAVLLLNAYHKGGNVYIEVCDDGRGLDRDKLISKAREKGVISQKEAEAMSDDEAFQLIMRAGFSTAAEVSDVSGRGVGMDVVRQNIDALSGEIQIKSEKGVGTNIVIRLPLTLAIMDGQLISVGQDTFVVPVVSIVESLQVNESMIRRVAGKGELLRYREDYLPVMRLHRTFGLKTDTESLDKGVVVVLDVDGKRLAVFVDSIFGQQQVAIKSLESNFQRVQGVMGATILGDGSIALILDPPSLSRMNSISVH